MFFCLEFAVLCSLIFVKKSCILRFLDFGEKQKYIALLPTLKMKRRKHFLHYY